MLKFSLQTAPFIEQPTVDETNNDFDIVQPLAEALEDAVKLNRYCHDLLFKIISLNKSRIKPFLQYQCEQLIDPFVWLNKLEKLIDLNREGFTTKDHNIKIEKALMVIELLRSEIESGKNKLSKYNFKKVKQNIQRYQTPEEKMSYLLEIKTDYLQNKPLVIDPTEVPFEIQCDLEVQLLKTKRKLTKQTKTTRNLETQKPETSVTERSRSAGKIRINSQVNHFVDIFYQLLHEKTINGLPYLEASTNDIAEMITTNFTDKEGNEISSETIKTILRPSRPEKRPKQNSRFILN
jgi:hypothetical protein